MFAQNTLASALTAAIGVSMVGLVQADAVFFPYVTLTDTTTTIVSVMNATANNWDGSGRVGATHLHYRFYYKPLTSGLTSPCEEYDEYLPTSRNDIQTIDLGGVFGAQTAGVLFKDPSINNKWKQSGRNYALGRYTKPAYGYLIVDNSDTNPADETLTGEAIVFDFKSGISWGYQAHSSTDGDFRSAASQSPASVAIMPFDEFATSFFVTPVSIAQDDFMNNYRARVELSASGRGDLYDRDENLWSGTIVRDMTCVGRIKAEQLMSAALLSRVSNGGWGKILSYRVVLKNGGWVPAAFKADAASGSPDGASLVPVANKNLASDGAVVIKLEYSKGKTFNGQAVNGTYDNAMMFASDKANPF